MIKPEDMEFIRRILPDHYVVTREGDYQVRCKSPSGIRCKRSSDGIEIEDEEHFGYIMQALKHHFAKKWNQVHHTVNTWHQDFDIYISR